MVATKSLSNTFLLNIQGINPRVNKQKVKFALLQESVSTNKNMLPFFVLTESHLSDQIFDAEVSIKDYNIIRADREARKQGGVAIYHHYLFTMDDTETYSNSYCECAMAYNKTNSLLVIGVYRPPDALPSVFKDCLEKIEKFINKYPKDSVLIFGDFNLKFINWETEKIEKPATIKQNITTNEKMSSNYLLDFVNDHLLIQLVKDNTRRQKSLLDLILTNNDEMIFNVNVESNSYDTDHDTVNCQVLLNNIQPSKINMENHSKVPLDGLCFQKADWQKIRNELSEIKWKEMFANATATEMHNLFEQVITNVAMKHAPARKKRNSRTTIPRKRLKLVRKRKEINTRINIYKFIKAPTENNYRKYQRLVKRKEEIEEEMKNQVEQELLQKEQAALEQMKKNPKYFYSFVKKFNQTINKIGPLKDKNDNLINDPEAKANILQDQYTKVFSNPNINDIPIEPKLCNELLDITITTEDIVKAIKDIPPNAAPGPDKIPASFLKECAKELAEPLLLLWRTSLDLSEIPEQLKIQTIIPLFKKGFKYLAENYRPVSLTSHIIKLFERILRKKIIKHIEENNLLSDNQHAFQAGRSPLSQLLPHVEFILNSMHDGKNVDVVYLDFAKAFDKVDHKILLQKVKNFGIKGKIYLWIKEFIENRYQQVLVEGSMSRKEKVVSGVPQGTVLGPILFLIYIDDLESAMKHSVLRIFADDSKIIKTVQNKEDHEMLQEDIDNAIKWSTQNNMELNKKKFQLLQYGKNNDFKYFYDTGQQTPLQKEPDVKNLGVYLVYLYLTYTISLNISYYNELTRYVTLV